jgi:hypothetical protein
MPFLQLLPHVSFAIVEDRALFLDLRRDRYFGLQPDAARAFEILRADPAGVVTDSPSAAALLATGLVSEADEPGAFLEPRIPPAEFELERDSGLRATPHDVVETAFLVARSRRALRSRRLDRILEEHRSRGVDPSSGRPAEQGLALAQRFRCARDWVPVRSSCLQDSLALHDWLARRGALAQLVLAVKLNPFAAHCWVQLGQTVLNDAPDRIAAFTPILVIE